MKVVLSNKSKVGIGRIVVDTNNKITKVNFSKVAKTGPVGLRDLYDVNRSGQQDGDVLVFVGNTSSYSIETLPKIDGGIF